MSKQSIRPQGAEGSPHGRTVQNPAPVVKQNPSDTTPAIDLALASIYLDCMLEQKERVRALLSVIQDIVRPISNPDLDTLVSLAADVNEDHARWYDLQQCLGIKETQKSGGEE